MAFKPPPFPGSVPIVDEKGLPTMFFQIWLKQLIESINKYVDEETP